MSAIFRKVSQIGNNGVPGPKKFFYRSIRHVFGSKRTQIGCSVSTSAAKRTKVAFWETKHDGRTFRLKNAYPSFPFSRNFGAALPQNARKSFFAKLPVSIGFCGKSAWDNLKLLFIRWSNSFCCFKLPCRRRIAGIKRGTRKWLMVLLSTNATGTTSKKHSWQEYRSKCLQLFLRRIRMETRSITCSAIENRN